MVLPYPTFAIAEVLDPHLRHMVDWDLNDQLQRQLVSRVHVYTASSIINTTSVNLPKGGGIPRLVPTYVW